MFERFSDIGIEVEYPIAQSEELRMKKRGRISNDLFERIELEDRDSWYYGGHVYEDCTIGAEIPSHVMNPDQMALWYKNTLDRVERYYGYPHEPCGVVEGDVGKTTAGLHVHLSTLSEADARWLHNISEESWFQAFICTSVTDDYKNVFRKGGTTLPRSKLSEGESTPRTSPVRKVRRSNGHYEWRLPEPMTREHMELFEEFFVQLRDNGTESAENFVRDLMNDADERVTSIARAKEVGVNEVAQSYSAQSPTIEQSVEGWLRNKVSVAFA